jgi:hypothetical protein
MERELGQNEERLYILIHKREGASAGRSKFVGNLRRGRE